MFIYIFTNLRFRGSNSLKIYSLKNAVICISSFVNIRFKPLVIYLWGGKKGGQKKRKTTGMLITLS